MPPMTQDTRRGRRRPRTIEAIAVAGLVLLALGFAEVCLQISGRSSRAAARLLAAPGEADSPLVPDERLIHRGNPLRIDHDEAGYQNESRPTQVDVVTLGDSMTYGLGGRAQAWPSIMAKIMGQRLYNMALPGYGPVHSLFQLDEALAFGPRVLIVAPYFGNDLFDAFAMARRHPGLVVSLPSDLVEQAQSVERRRMFELEVPTPFRLGVDGSEERISAMRRWMSRNLGLYKLVRAAKNRLTMPPASDPLLSRDFGIAAAAITPARLQLGAAPFEGSGWRTILYPRYRLQALDDSDPRIRVGFLVMSAALEEMAERSRAAAVRFLVVLFPTKESVFWPRVTDPDVYAGLRALVATEDRLRAELTARLTSRGIDVIDLLDVLRRADEQPYYEDLDGHPNMAGNRVVAAAVAAQLTREQP
jgi:lysophospholipase L1-like esterase